ncbi:hypothetical protein H6G50_02545 [Oscillatoria sp. FACHB-1406]|nr:hypothetical protein [Oscillatoria sp. FACHB-1406]MBD2576566.1 hypothetical protein [Oscillatoria sp. FACHB-1406]
MYAPLFVNLGVAAVALYLALNTPEEIVRVAAGFVAVLCSFLTLFFAPWPVKLLLLLLPFAIGKLRRPRSLSGKVES